MFNIELQWKEFNLDANSIESWMRANAGEHYTGCSCNSKLELHFQEEPSDEIKEAIAAHWDSLDENSDEAKAYKSDEERESEAAAAKAALVASASAKLEALGLSVQEIAALKG